jgi:eukaryotic-like serine/threonine-protein kinase
LTIPVGTKLGPYVIRSQIGEGGMGEVYLAEDTRLDRRVALKILPKEFAEDKQRMSRFVREAKSVSALNHPNIITIYEIGESEGTHFIATEFIDGKTLNDYAKANPIDYKSLLEIAIQIVSALDEAHTAGIVHRDIKPDNVMIRANGLVKILDFGIAKLSAPASTDKEATTAIQSNTQVGMIIGTPQFMSPEQARGKGVDHQTDIFSFGVVLYQLLSGASPFVGETISDVIAAVLTKEPRALTGVPPGFAEIIGKTLQKEKRNRYRTAKDLLRDLREVKQELEFQDKLERTAPNQEQIKTQVLQSVATNGNQEAERQTYAQSTIPDLKSIAVLPFANMSADADNEYFCDGLAEELLNALAKIEDLRVAARTSAFSFKGKNVEISEMGKALKVNTILEGSVRKSGNRIRIAVQLVSATNGYHLWSERYDREMRDIFDVQDEITLAVVDALKVKLLGEKKTAILKRGTKDTEAFELYLRGLFYYNKRTADDIRKAIGLFEQAIKKDPDYALAHASVAESFNTMTAYPYLSPKEASPQAKASAIKALEIDPTLAEAHTTLATYFATYEWNWTEAEREFKRAIELSPNNTSAHFRYGLQYLAAIGRNEEAIAELERVVEVEPLSLITGANLAAVYTFAGENKRALDQAQKTYDLEPHFLTGRYFLGVSYNANGMYAEAIALSKKHLETEPESQLFLRLVGYAYAKAGRRREAENVIMKFREIAATQYVMSYWVANIYAALGNNDKAFAELEKAFAEHDWELHRLKVDPFMNSLRDDPRFNEMAKRIGLPQ